jgi:ATP-dependent RNA helicase RhlB
LITSIFRLIRKLFTRSDKPKKKSAKAPSSVSKETSPISEPGTQRFRVRGSRKKQAQPPGEVLQTTNRSESTPKDLGHPDGVTPPQVWNAERFVVPACEGRIRFQDLGLPDLVLHAIADLGFQYCTPIQGQLFPDTLGGRDAYGRAQTGTGKTAAFLITAITRMLSRPLDKKPENGRPRMLVLAPTRELVMQIAAEAQQLSKYCSLNIVTVFGGMDYDKQRRQLTGRVVDIVVATPGRLLDFHRHRDVDLGKIEILVIDEADRMLDMGFIPDVRKIVYATPYKDKRQTMLFSATLTEEVTRLSAQWTRDPVSVEIEPEQVAVETVEQVVYIVTTREKFALLYNYITSQNLERVLIFCNRRDETRRLADLFTRYRINCALLSGEIPQKKRIRTLENFKAGKIRVLVATDVAGRGIHIEDMSHVINFTLPHDPEDYVHRIGRTGRAGATGTSISFACEEDSFYIPAIEEFIGQKLNCIQPQDAWLQLPPPPPRKKSPLRQRRRTVASTPRRPRRAPGRRTQSSRPSRRSRKTSTSQKSVPRG